MLGSTAGTRFAAFARTAVSPPTRRIPSRRAEVIVSRRPRDDVQQKCRGPGTHSCGPSRSTQPTGTRASADQLCSTEKCGENKMKKYGGNKMKLLRPVIALAAGGAAFVVAASPALAQSGHFMEQGAGAPVCTDIGLQVSCTGKVSGLGGTTFEITFSAAGIASVECENPSGNVA